LFKLLVTGANKNKALYLQFHSQNNINGRTMDSNYLFIELYVVAQSTRMVRWFEYCFFLFFLEKK